MDVADDVPVYGIVAVLVPHVRKIVVFGLFDHLTMCIGASVSVKHQDTIRTKTSIDVP